MTMLLQLGVSVVVQFYPWFKFYFLLFQTHYHVIIIHYHTQKQKKRKFKPMIKLNHNIDLLAEFPPKSVLNNNYIYCERFEPRSHFKSRLSLIVRVNIVLNRTVAVDSD